MKISYGVPLSKGWDRMKHALFNPFDLGKWFLLGFTAFLAGLADRPGFGNGSYKSGRDHWNFNSFADFFNASLEWLADNPFWSMLIIWGILFLIALGILITWLSSRGKFMFLDNVVHDRALVSEPWNQFKTIGDSLFIWRICFGIIVFAVVGLFLFAAVSSGYDFHNNSFSGFAAALRIALMALVFFIIMFITGYISLFLSHFIVPIMYKNSISAVEAWRLFMSLLTRHLLHFILYGIIIFLLYLLVFFCVTVIGLFTCCIGFIILSIPYIGAVLVLPVSYTFRALSVEFLEQFGPEYEIFPKLDDNDINEVYEI